MKKYREFKVSAVLIKILAKNFIEQKLPLDYCYQIIRERSLRFIDEIKKCFRKTERVNDELYTKV